MLWDGMGRVDFHSHNSRTALDGSDSLWHRLWSMLQHWGLQHKGVNREEAIFEFLLGSMLTAPFRKESLYVGKLALRCCQQSSAGIACCTFRDRQKRIFLIAERNPFLLCLSKLREDFVISVLSLQVI